MAEEERSLADRAYGGSAGRLVAAFVRSGQLDREERAGCAAFWTRWRCSRWKISGCFFSRRWRRAVRPLSPSAPADLPKSALPPVAVRDLGVLVLRLLIPVGAWGRSTVLDVGPGWRPPGPGQRLTAGLRIQLPLDTLPPPGPHPPSPSGGPRSLTDWLFLLYLAGALGLALWYLGCALHLSLRVSRGVPVEGPGGRPSTLWPSGTSCPAPGAWWSAAGSEAPS